MAIAAILLALGFGSQPDRADTSLLDLNGRASTEYFWTFNLLNSIPPTVAAAVAEGFESFVPGSTSFPDFVAAADYEGVSDPIGCDSQHHPTSALAGLVGNVYAYPKGHKDYRPHGLYPAPFYSVHDGSFAGLVLAIDKKYVIKGKVDTDDPPWQHGRLAGQIYWVQDPQSVCSEVPPAEPKRAFYVRMPKCIEPDTVCADGGNTDAAGSGIIQLPNRLLGSSAAEKLNQLKGATGLTDSLIDHMCYEGMGDHYVYASCKKAFFYSPMYDADGFVSGVIAGVFQDESAVTSLAQDNNATDWTFFSHFPHGEKSWGLPMTTEGKTFQKIVSLVYDETYLPNCAAGAGNEDCFQCKPIPRVYLHLQRGLPARDFKTCEDGQYLSPGASTATFLGKRCGKCQKTLNNMARHLPHGTSCAQKRDFVQDLFYSRSCGRPEWWSNLSPGDADDQMASGDFTCALNEEYLFKGFQQNGDECEGDAAK